MKKFYEVKRYEKITVFDKNLNLVYRWKLIETYGFYQIKHASRAFRIWNLSDKFKAVLRIKYAKKGGHKRG